MSATLTPSPTTAADRPAGARAPHRGPPTSGPTATARDAPAS